MVNTNDGSIQAVNNQHVVVSDNNNNNNPNLNLGPTLTQLPTSNSIVEHQNKAPLINKSSTNSSSSNNPNNNSNFDTQNQFSSNVHSSHAFNDNSPALNLNHNNNIISSTNNSKNMVNLNNNTIIDTNNKISQHNDVQQKNVKNNNSMIPQPPSLNNDIPNLVNTNNENNNSALINGNDVNIMNSDLTSNNNSGIDNDKNLMLNNHFHNDYHNSDQSVNHTNVSITNNTTFLNGTIPNSQHNNQHIGLNQNLDNPPNLNNNINTTTTITSNQESSLNNNNIESNKILPPITQQNNNNNNSLKSSSNNNISNITGINNSNNSYDNTNQIDIKETQQPNILKRNSFNMNHNNNNNNINNNKKGDVVTNNKENNLPPGFTSQNQNITNNLNNINNNSNQMFKERLQKLTSKDISEVDIVSVYKYNLHEEFARVREVVKKYKYIAMDTEFPGVCMVPENWTQISDIKANKYHLIKANVDCLNIIQLGLCFFDEEGNLAPDTSVWQFHFYFNISQHMYNEESIKLLKDAGINFEKLQDDGISRSTFAELFTTSGVVLNKKVTWITYHSGYDILYLMRIFRADYKLPDDFDDFMALVKVVFPNLYDIKFICKQLSIPDSGLANVAESYGVKRTGDAHQAGSDSLMTGQTFFEMRKSLKKQQQIILQKQESEKELEDQENETNNNNNSENENNNDATKNNKNENNEKDENNNNLLIPATSSNSNTKINNSKESLMNKIKNLTDFTPYKNIIYGIGDGITELEKVRHERMRHYHRGYHGHGGYNSYNSGMNAEGLSNSSSNNQRLFDANVNRLPSNIQPGSQPYRPVNQALTPTPPPPGIEKDKNLANTKSSLINGDKKRNNNSNSTVNANTINNKTTSR